MGLWNYITRGKLGDLLKGTKTKREIENSKGYGHYKSISKEREKFLNQLDQEDLKDNSQIRKRREMRNAYHEIKERSSDQSVYIPSVFVDSTSFAYDRSISPYTPEESRCSPESSGSGSSDSQEDFSSSGSTDSGSGSCD